MGLPVIEGGISHILERFTQNALPVYSQINERIKAADFLGTDETGAKVNGKNIGSELGKTIFLKPLLHTLLSSASQSTSRQ